MSKVLLVDAYNMLHRSRFGFGSGDHSVTFNFFRSLRSEIDRHMPNKVYIVTEGYPVHREVLSGGNYKANRERLPDPAFHRQKKEIFELVKHFPISLVRHPDFECDDVIGTLSRHHALSGDEAIVCSSDSDFIQLLENKNIKLWNPVKKSFIEKWPVDYLTWKGLKGDPTDNVTGVKGVGEKTAFKLTEDPDLLTEFLAKKDGRKEAFENSKEQIKLVDIDLQCKKWEHQEFEFNENIVFEEFKSRGFKTIIGNAWVKWQKTMQGIKDEQNSTHRSSNL